MSGSAPVSDELLAALKEQYDGVQVEAELLAALRRRLGASALEYAEPPTPLLGGTEFWIFGFRLAGAPEGWRGPLVLRMARDGQPDTDLGFEAAVQNAVASQGFPAPRALASDGDGSELGRPYLVMERLPGEAGPVGLFRRPSASTLALLLGVPRLLATLPRLQAQALLRLHALDAGGLRDALAARGALERASLDARLATIAADAAETGHARLADLVGWLHAKRPPQPAHLSICHGDFHAFNLLFEPGRISGVIDWTGARIADPALDLGVVRAQLEISQLPVAGVPGRLVHAVQMRLLRTFERTYARECRVDPDVLDWYEMLPCAAAVARMLRLGSDPNREPLVELAWEHPRALRRLEARVRQVTAVELGLDLTCDTVR